MKRAAGQAVPGAPGDAVSIPIAENEVRCHCFSVARFRLLTFVLVAGTLPLSAQGEGDPRPPIPPDLLNDPHVREELAVNEFTAPSIAKIFDSLSSLAPLARNERKLPEKPPINRADLAVELGFLIAEGFLIVQASEFGKVEGLAADLSLYAKALGAGDRVNKHAAGLLANAKKGDTEQVKKDLTATQADVEADLVELRDADLAHLISLGGWVRALEVSAPAVERQFDERRAREIMREDIADYYASIVGSLEPRIAERPDFVQMRELLSTMRGSMLIDDDNPPTLERVVEIRKQSDKLADLALERSETP